MTATAQSVRHTGLARVNGEHLVAQNEPLPAAELKRWQDRSWRYVPSDQAHSVEQTWARFGWVPASRRLSELERSA